MHSMMHSFTYDSRQVLRALVDHWQVDAQQVRVHHVVARTSHTHTHTPIHNIALTYTVVRVEINLLRIRV